MTKASQGANAAAMPAALPLRWSARFLVVWPKRALIRGFYTMTRLAHVFGFLEGGNARS